MEPSTPLWRDCVAGTESEPNAPCFLPERLLRRAGCDAAGRPVLVFSLAELPDPAATDYDLLLSDLLDRAEQLHSDAASYSLVVLATLGKHVPQTLFLYNAFTQLTRRLRKTISKVYVVEGMRWMQWMFTIFTPFVSPKFARKIIWLANAGELEGHLDIPAPVVPDKELPRPPPAMPKLFGMDLRDAGCPEFVQKTCAFILENGVETPGIFRISPAISASLRFKTLLNSAENSGDAAGWTFDADPILAAALLKTFVRELAHPLIPATVYPIVHSLDHPAAIWTAVANSWHPPETQLVSHLLLLLRKISENSAANLMTSHNLGIVFAPNLARSEDPIADMSVHPKVVAALTWAIDNCAPSSAVTSAESSPVQSETPTWPTPTCSEATWTVETPVWCESPLSAAKEARWTPEP